MNSFGCSAPCVKAATACQMFVAVSGGCPIEADHDLWRLLQIMRELLDSVATDIAFWRGHQLLGVLQQDGTLIWIRAVGNDVERVPHRSASEGVDLRLLDELDD